MTSDLPNNQAPITPEPSTETTAPPPAPQDSYVKLAMRNMVKKSGTSLKHFALTTIGLMGLLIGLAYLTR